VQAQVGDHLVIGGRHVGDHQQMAEVLEIHGAAGEPPYLVRWEDGRVATYFPGSDAVIEHVQPKAASPPGT
jgi:hypothetical protein